MAKLDYKFGTQIKTKFYLKAHANKDRYCESFCEAMFIDFVILAETFESKTCEGLV